MFFRPDGGGLHRADAGEDVKELGVPRGGDGAEEEELVHCGSGLTVGKSKLKGEMSGMKCVFSESNP